MPIKTKPRKKKVGVKKTAPAKKKAVAKKKAPAKNLPAQVEQKAPALQQSQLPVSEKTIKEYLFGLDTKLTEPQQALFIKTCKIYNLNPFKREAYAIPYGSKFSIITGYEVYIKKANQLRVLNGWNVDIEGTGENRKARITIHRKDWKNPFTHEVLLSEYNNGTNPLWKSKPITMLRKVVTAQGFRLCFPEEFDGMPYTEDEFHPDDNESEVIEVNGEVINEKKTKSELIAEFTLKFQEYASLEQPSDELNAFMNMIETFEEDVIEKSMLKIERLIQRVKDKNNR